MPERVVAFVADQLDIAGCLPEYRVREKTAYEHAWQIRDVFGYREFPAGEQDLCTRLLADPPLIAYRRASRLCANANAAAGTVAITRADGVALDVWDRGFLSVVFAVIVRFRRTLPGGTLPKSHDHGEEAQSQ